MSQSLMSVIVPVYNVKEYLNTCVESILNQTHENLEVILVDDGSTDGQRRNLRFLCKDRYQGTWCRIPKTADQAAARNRRM